MTCIAPAPQSDMSPDNILTVLGWFLLLPKLRQCCLHPPRSLTATSTRIGRHSGQLSQTSNDSRTSRALVLSMGTHLKNYQPSSVITQLRTWYQIRLVWTRPTPKKMGKRFSVGPSHSTRAYQCNLYFAIVRFFVKTCCEQLVWKRQLGAEFNLPRRGTFAQPKLQTLMVVHLILLPLTYSQSLRSYWMHDATHHLHKFVEKMWWTTIIFLQKFVMRVLSTFHAYFWKRKRRIFAWSSTERATTFAHVQWRNLNDCMP